jgi:FKBP-type peptidyl-prolyl cis-trans isomerase
LSQSNDVAGLNVLSQKEFQMKMKTQWMFVLSLCLCGFNALAEQSVVIDSQSLREAPAATKSGESAPAADGREDANSTNKAQFIKGGKMSAREKREVAKAAVAETNLQAGTDFLTANRAKPGVISLPSGVQYKILRAGTGKQPTENSQVRCRYKGKLIDGSTIDKSDDKKPSTLQVSGFVQGLREAVTLMPTGSKWQIVVPPQLAYGAAGYHAAGPNAVIIYEMEILGIK